MFTNHLNINTYELLESYRIGNFVEVIENKNDPGDPYSNDPMRIPIMNVLNQKPFNGEPPLPLLVKSFITPNEIHYVRNHLPVPVIDPNEYVLEITGLGIQDTVKLTLDDLKKLPEHKLVVTIQCSGNRRAHMNEEKQTKGLEWKGAAIGNAEWSGVRLRDLLNYIGFEANRKEMKHFQFEGYDQDITKTNYGVSFPFSKAYSKDGDVLVAYKMNGEDIPRDHGYPVRIIIPGVVGTRNVKWLKKIIISDEESQSFWQQSDYKGFSPSIDMNHANYKLTPAIQDLPVQSQICETSINDDEITIKGYAWSGGGRGIAWVDVSLDNGDTWNVANIDPPIEEEYGKNWSWRLWEITLPIPKNQNGLKIKSKAVDTSYNAQPERISSIWNYRGVLTNAWSSVDLK